MITHFRADANLDDTKAYILSLVVCESSHSQFPSNPFNVLMLGTSVRLNGILKEKT